MRAPLAVLALAAAVLAPAAWAQQTDALRPCRAEDLPGVWDVVRLRASSSWPVDRSQPYYFQFQRYVFAADGGARHLTATMPLGPAQHEAMVSGPPAARWTLDGHGWLTIDKEEGPPDVSQCQVVERQIVDSRQRLTASSGELLLTHYSNSAPVMRRQLAKHPTLAP
jgi:invasion protein IalB